MRQDRADLRKEARVFAKIFNRDYRDEVEGEREDDGGVEGDVFHDEKRRGNSAPRFIERSLKFIVVRISGQRNICRELYSLRERFERDALTSSDLSTTQQGIFMYYDKLPQFEDANDVVLWEIAHLRLKLGTLENLKTKPRTLMTRLVNTLTARFEIPAWPVNYFCAWDALQTFVLNRPGFRLLSTQGEYAFDIDDSVVLYPEDVTVYQHIVNNQDSFREVIRLMEDGI